MTQHHNDCAVWARKCGVLEGENKQLTLEREDRKPLWQRKQEADLKAWEKACAEYYGKKEA